MQIKLLWDCRAEKVIAWLTQLSISLVHLGRDCPLGWAKMFGIAKSKFDSTSSSESFSCIVNPKTKPTPTRPSTRPNPLWWKENRLLQLPSTTIELYYVLNVDLYSQTMWLRSYQMAILADVKTPGSHMDTWIRHKIKKYNQSLSIYSP